jgi:hypothetical protein
MLSLLSRIRWLVLAGTLPGIEKVILNGRVLDPSQLAANAVR